MEEEKDITVFICENDDLAKRIIDLYVKDTSGEFDRGVTYIQKFKASDRHKIVRVLDEI